MKKHLITTLVACSLIPSAFATITYNDTITYINGSGNPNTGWTSDTEANGIQVALRGDYRANGATPNNGAGTYTFQPGLVSGKASWNYQFTINSDKVNGVVPLAAYDFWIAMTGSSPANGPVALGPANALINGAWSDNTYGNNGTPNGGGTTALNPAMALALSGVNNVSANSESITFLGLQNDYLGVYNFELYATAAGAGAGGAKLADVSITVDVVPEPQTYWCGAALLGVCGLALRRRAQTA